MPAYEGAYVTLLTEMGSAYVPMCFSGFLARGALGHGQIGQIGQIGQNLTHNVSPQRRQVWRRTARPRHSAKANQKSTLPAPNSIEFGVGKVDFGTERDQKAPQKNSRAFPLVLKG